MSTLYNLQVIGHCRYPEYHRRHLSTLFTPSIGLALAIKQYRQYG